MAVLQSVWIVIAVSIFEIAQAFYPLRSPCLPSFPRHDSGSSCRDSIEDLKALLEITQALQPNQSYTCPSCSSTFSEEIILKLVNALIFTATQNCGNSNVGGGGGNTGGIHPGVMTGGGNTNPVGGGSNSGGIHSHGHGRGLINGGSTGMRSPSGGSNGEGLIQLGILDGQDTAHLDLAGKKVLGVDLGPQSGSGSGRGVPINSGNSWMQSPSGNSPNGGSNGEGLIQLGILDGQDTAHLDLAGKKVLGVDLGPQPGSGNGRGVPINSGNSGMQSPSGNSPNGGSNGEGLIQLGVLDGQDTAHLDLAGKKILGVDLGPQSGSGGSTGGGTGGLTGNNGGNNTPSSTSNSVATSQTSHYSSNTVPIANNNMNTVTTPVNVETIVYKGASPVQGNTDKLTDGYNGFEGMAKPVIGD